MGVESRKKSVAEPAKPMLLGGTAIKPPERHGLEKIQYLIYDKETGEVFTRTPKSWFLITVFYLIYYTLLACFWYGMLQLFFITLPETEPKYQLEASIIGASPGVGMRPSQPDSTIDSSMLYLKMDANNEKPSKDFESHTNVDWAERYRVVVNRYTNETGTRPCSSGDYEYAKPDQDPCAFDPAVLGDCNNFPYGYQMSGSSGNVVEPCIMIKLNRIYGWKPEPYTEEDLDVVPEDERDAMPNEVKQHVRDNDRQVYLFCRGENPYDREQLKGKIKYFPADGGIPFRFFPYTQAHKPYHTPLVAVKFTDLQPEVLHHIECRAWFKGVRHSKKDRRGLVHLEIFLAKDYQKEE